MKAGGFLLKYNELQAIKTVMACLVIFCLIDVPEKVLDFEEVISGVFLDSLTNSILVDEIFEA